jgi:vacuolar-type H+-ATPase subunit F/Vma7
MTFFCIADKESSLGFRLAGIETREVSTKPEVIEALKVARLTKDVGIILITEKAASFVREEIEHRIAGEPIPLVLEVPSRGSTGKKKSAAELLKELVGIGI